MINMEKDKKEEIIHRREFFRKAVKGLLPIVASLSLGVIPTLGKETQPPQYC